MRSFPKKTSKHNTRISPDATTRCPICDVLFSDGLSLQDHTFFCRMKKERKPRTDGWREPP